MKTSGQSCVIITPDSAHLRGVCGFYERALTSLGFYVSTVNPRRSANIIADARDALEIELYFFLSFEGECTSIIVDGDNLANVIRRPFISLCEGEPPMVERAPRVLLGLRDRYEAEGSHFFAPQPGLCADGGDVPRDIDVVWFYDPLMPPDGFRAQWHADATLGKICEDMIDILLADERATGRQAFDMVMSGYGIYLESWKPAPPWVGSDCGHARAHIRVRDDFKSACIRLVNGFMQNHRRGLLLDMLKKKHVNVTAVPSPGFNEYLELLKRAKIAVCANAALAYSLPEIAACGMASGAAVACDGNAFTDEVFPQGGYILYSHNDYSSLADNIKDALAHPERLCEMAENGRKMIESAYTPVHAAKQLIWAADHSLLKHN